MEKSKRLLSQCKGNHLLEIRKDFFSDLLTVYFNYEKVFSSYDLSLIMEKFANYLDRKEAII